MSARKMVKVVDDRANLVMSIKELRVLRKVLGQQSTGRLKDEGCSASEVRVFEEIYAALCDFFCDIA